MSKLVLIWPSPWDNRLKDSLFETGFSLRGSFKRAFSLWREQAKAAGYELHTWDMAPIERADILWFINMPRTRREYIAVRRLNPKAITVLQINESPLLAPHMFHLKNQESFDIVVTYERTRSKREGIFHYHLPFTLELNATHVPYESRKHACIINSNRFEGWFAMRQPGLAGLPGLGVALSGWHYGLADLWVNHRHGLYSARRELCRVAESIEGLQFDIYGAGWDGEQISWCPLYPHRKYALLKKKRVEDKLKTAAQYRFNIAYENYQGNHGYVDIKIFDSLLAGSVPVYIGDAGIADMVPGGCFVDGNTYDTARELLEFLRDCPEAEWRRMYADGQSFLRSEKVKAFTDEAFADRMVEILKKIAPQ